MDDIETLSEGGAEATASNLLATCENSTLLRLAVIRLWNILDDIDTVSDIVKGDDALYRSLVEGLQAKRHNTGITTDGYSLFVGSSSNSKQAPQPGESK